MTIASEIQSWLPILSGPEVHSIPKTGDPAPTHDKLPLPGSDSRPTVVSFLRHCGCPYAEKTFLELRKLASQHKDVRVVAVSHSSRTDTEKWLEDLGGAGHVEIIIDHEREVYAAWGLGAAGLFSILNPTAMSGVGKLEKEEGIKLRDTGSGSRWQKAGSFAIDAQGIVRWVSVAESAEQIGDLEDGIRLMRECSEYFYSGWGYLLCLYADPSP